MNIYRMKLPVQTTFDGSDCRNSAHEYKWLQMHQLATRLTLKSTEISKKNLLIKKHKNQNKPYQLVHWTFSEAQTFVQVGQIQVFFS